MPGSMLGSCKIVHKKQSRRNHLNATKLHLDSALEDGNKYFRSTTKWKSEAFNVVQTHKNIDLQAFSLTKKARNWHIETNNDDAQKSRCRAKHREQRDQGYAFLKIGTVLHRFKLSTGPKLIAPPLINSNSRWVVIRQIEAELEVTTCTAMVLPLSLSPSSSIPEPTQSPPHA